MKSTAHIKGHPIHPMLIPYPFALLTSATGFDIAARVSGRTAYAQTAAHMSRAGLASALVAAIPGVIDYFGSVPRRSQASRTATVHAALNISALTCFAFAGARRSEGDAMPPAGILLSLAGTGLLSLGGWFGGELVYHEQVGVVAEGTPTSTVAPAIGETATGGEPGQGVVHGGDQR